MKIGYQKNRLIALCSVVYFASYLSRKNFAVAMAGMLAEGVFDKVTAGLVGTALFAAYGFGQIISGFLGDKLKPKHMILFGLSLTSLCNLLMPLVPDAAMMIPLWAVNGLAQAMLWPPIVRLLSENLSHADYVLGNALVTCAAHAATMILYLYVPLCLQLWSWQTVFYTASALVILVFVFFFFGLRSVLPENPSAAVKLLPKQRANEGGVGSYLRLLASCGVLPLLLSVALQGYLRDGIDSWLPTMFSEVFQADASNSILLSVTLPIFAMIAMFLSLRLHRRLLQNEALGTGVLFTFASVFGLILFFVIGIDHPVARVATLLLAALITTCAHCCNFFLISCLPGHFARFGRAATTSGFCNAFTYLGSAVASYGIALIAENAGWGANILSWVGITLLGVLCSILAYRRYTRFFEKSHELEQQEEKEMAESVA